MGTSLTGLTPATTYDALIKVGDNGPLSATAKVLSDGLGNDSALALSTTLVGIGTSTPLYKLDTRGISAVFNAGIDGVLEPTLYLGHPNFTSSYLNKISTSVSAAPGGQQMQFSIANGASTYADVMTLNGQGNVGIGTSSPESKLHVVDSVSGGIVSVFVDNNVNALNSTAQIKFTVDSGGSLTGGGAAIQAVNVDPNFASTDLVFRNSGNSIGSLSEAMRITGSGTSYLRLSSTIGGIQFNGDTSAANALDDYEEGTFTPTAIGATTTGTTTYTAQNGYYTKIGRQVTVNLFVAYSSLTGTGDIRIGGLPFAIANFTENYPIGSCVVSALDWTNGTYLQAIAFPNESNIYIAYIGDDVSANLQQCVDEAATFRITMTYFV